MNFIGEFEHALSLEARKRDVDGVICGHIHQVAMKQIDDVLYINTGDWVESCTAIGETMDGSFEVIYWKNGAAISVPENKKQIVTSERSLEDAA